MIPAPEGTGPPPSPGPPPRLPLNGLSWRGGGPTLSHRISPHSRFNNIRRPPETTRMKDTGGSGCYYQQIPAKEIWPGASATKDPPGKPNSLIQRIDAGRGLRRRLSIDCRARDVRRQKQAREEQHRCEEIGRAGEMDGSARRDGQG